MKFWESIGKGAKAVFDYIILNYKAIGTLGTYVTFWIAVLKRVALTNSADDIPDISTDWVLLLTALLGLHVAESISARIQSTKSGSFVTPVPPQATP